MRILIIGRGANTVNGAVARIGEYGFAAEGVTTDDAAADGLDTARFGVLLIGGGVERESRARLKEHAARCGVTVLEGRRNGRDIDSYLREEVVPFLRDRS